MMTQSGLHEDLDQAAGLPTGICHFMSRFQAQDRQEKDDEEACLAEAEKKSLADHAARQTDPVASRKFRIEADKAGQKQQRQQKEKKAENVPGNVVA